MGKAAIPDEPKYLNLYDLVGYVRAHLTDLLNGTYSDQGVAWGKAWITELSQRLEEIQKELPKASQSQNVCKVKLSLSIIVALREAAIAAELTAADECQYLYQLRQAISKMRRSFQKLLKDPTKAEKNIQQLQTFCDRLRLELPWEERFVAGPVSPEIKIPRIQWTGGMADGQPGEAG